MANKKISELQSRTPALSDLMLVGDPSSGYSYKCTITALATIIETDIADGYVTIGTTQTISGAKTFSNNLTLTSVVNTPTDPDKFLTLNASNVVTYRTGAEVLSDIGAASSSSISGTTNYIPKFTSSSAIGNSQIQDDGTKVTVGTGLYVNSGTNTNIGNGIHTYYESNYAQIQLNGATNGGSIIDFSTSGTDYKGRILYDNTSNYFTFSTNTAERMRLDASGNLGLGTSTFGTYGKLSVAGGIRILDDNNAKLEIGRYSSGASNSYIKLGANSNSLRFTNNTDLADLMELTNSGNLGLGVSPSAWGSTFKSFDESAGNLASFSTSELYLTQGGYNNSGWKYTATGFASQYLQVNGQHRWNIAGSGSANGAISFTQAMTLDASGRLGIGTTSPKSYSSLTTNGQIISLSNIGIDVLQSYRLNNYYNSGTGTDRTISTGYSAGIGLDQSGGGLTFSTSSSSVTADNNVTVTERMRITSGGNVEVRSGNLLLLYNAANTRYGVLTTNINGTELSSFNGAGEPLILTSPVGNILFNTNSSERMRITSGGLLLVNGTTNYYNYQAQVNGAIYSYSSAQDRGIVIFPNQSTPNIQGVIPSSGNVGNIALNASGGNVGIATSSPASLLAVGGNPPSAGTISAVSASGGITLALSDNVNSSLYVRNTNGGAIIGTDGGGTIRFATSGNTNSEERMRLTSTGELLINTTSDAGDYKLQVNGNGYFSGNLETNVDLVLSRTSVSPAIVTTNGSFRLYKSAGAGAQYSISYDNNTITFDQAIKTGAPSGGTAKPWKLGEAGVTLGGSNTSGVRVEIDGVVYYLVTGYLP